MHGEIEATKLARRPQAIAALAGVGTGRKLVDCASCRHRMVEQFVGMLKGIGLARSVLVDSVTANFVANRFVLGMSIVRTTTKEGMSQNGRRNDDVKQAMQNRYRIIVIRKSLIDLFYPKRRGRARSKLA